MIKISKKLNLSTYIGFLLLLFAVISFISILFLKNNSIISNKLEQEIMFSAIQRDTSNILVKVLYEYAKEKDLLRNKHEIVLNYINEQKDPLTLDLDEIYNKINDKNKKYNIYISDDNLVIRNTTFRNDMGFNLSFSKESFEKHKKEKEIGISLPIMETSTNKFISFTDTYLKAPNDNKILQVSYTYEGLEESLQKLQNSVSKYEKVKDLKVYLYFEDEKFPADFYFKKYKELKPSLEELENRIKQSSELSKVNLNSPVEKIVKKDDKYFHEVYIIQESPIFPNAKMMYTILFDQSEQKTMMKNYNILLYLIIFISILSLIITFYMRKIENKHTLDNLTKTYNRDGFESIYEIETKRCARYENPFSMIMLDIDFFKKINDNYGHLIGDEILISMCDLINKSIRESDYLVRWGGEEFFVITPEIDLHSAVRLAEKLRILIDETEFDKVGHLTISLSVVQKNDDESKDEFLKRLDDLLYYSKNTGRNKTSF